MVGLAVRVSPRPPDGDQSEAPPPHSSHSISVSIRRSGPLVQSVCHPLPAMLLASLLACTAPALVRAALSDYEDIDESAIVKIGKCSNNDTSFGKSGIFYTVFC